MRKAKMNTELSIIMNKIREANGDTMEKLANKLNVTKSYISIIENGKRKVPDNYSLFIKQIYNLSNKEYLELESAIAKTNKYVKFDINSYTNLELDLLLLLKTKIQSLNDSDINELNKILQYGGSVSCMQ